MDNLKTHSYYLNRREECYTQDPDDVLRAMHLKWKSWKQFVLRNFSVKSHHSATDTVSIVFSISVYA